jgi:hypothetical protein
MEDSMIVHARTRRISTPAYYLGRPAALWLAALAAMSTIRKSPRALRRAVADLTPQTRLDASADTGPIEITDQWGIVGSIPAHSGPTRG